MRARVQRLLLLMTTAFLLPVATNAASGALPGPVRPFLWLGWPLAAALAALVVAHEIRHSPGNGNSESGARQSSDELLRLVAGPAPDYRYIARRMRRLPVKSVCAILTARDIWPGEKLADSVARSTLVRERAHKVLDHMRSGSLGRVALQLLHDDDFRAYRIDDLLEPAKPATVFTVLDQLDIADLNLLMGHLFYSFRSQRRDAKWATVVASRGRFPRAFGDLSLLSEKDCKRVLGMTPPELTLKMLGQRIRRMHKAVRQLSGERATAVLRQHSEIDSALMLVAAAPEWTAAVMEPLSSTDCARLVGCLSLISPSHAAQALDLLGQRDEGVSSLRAILASMETDRMLETIAALPPRTAGAIIATAGDSEWARLVVTDAISVRVSARILNTLSADQALAVMGKNIDRAILLIKAEKSCIGAVWPSYIISTMDDSAAKALLEAVGAETVAQLLRAMEPKDAARLTPAGVTSGTRVTSISMVRSALLGIDDS